MRKFLLNNFPKKESNYILTFVVALLTCDEDIISHISVPADAQGRWDSNVHPHAPIIPIYLWSQMLPLRFSKSRLIFI